jgi:hypothetical protein
LSPAPFPKRLRILVVRAISLSEGRRNKTTASAYKETRCCIDLEDNDWRSPDSAAFEIRRFRASMTILKSMGESRSPCLSPL